MDAQIREVVERFAAPLRGRHGEVIDLMGDFTNPIPNAVISRITGVPPGATRCASASSRRTIRGFFPFAPPEARARGRVALPGDRELGARRWSTKRRAHAGEDLISDLLRAQDARRRALRRRDRAC